MKKRILVLFIGLIIGFVFSLRSFAQTKQDFSFGYHFTFEYKGSYYGVKDTSLSGIKSFKMINEKHPIWLGVKLNHSLVDFFSSSVKSISKAYPSYIISDTSTAILIAYGITKANIKDYRYHVVENDSVELVPWSKIPALGQQYGATEAYGFLGKFKAPGKQLLIEVLNIKNYDIREGVLFDWKPNFKPLIAGIEINRLKDYFDLYNVKLNHGYATKFNEHNGTPIDFRFPADSVSNIRLYYKHHETIPYVVYLVKKVGIKKDTVKMGYYNLENYYDIDGNFYKQPGKYEIITQRAGELGSWPEEQILRLPFDVLPPPVTDKKVSLKQALPYIIATLTGVVLLFGGYYRRNQVKLLRAAQEKQTAGLKLQSIRAQLNPHFMFNALTSIQNLVNKNDIAGANHYLSKFAGLTRRVLDTGNEGLLSLEQELTILDDYLQMEQLRFGFEFNITVDSSINSANVEIPAMLLQPFAENAVKHGVAILKDKGKIEVAITREEKDLLFCITDNGKWIDKSNDDVISGYGLKLSEERVALLNQLYKEQPLSLTINKQPATVVCIRLSNWI
jgi:hypothetical protein